MSLSGEAVQIAHDLADDHVLAAALAGRHVSLLHVDHLAERLAVSDELIRVSAKTGDRERALQGLHARIFDLLQSGEVAAARGCLDELAALAAEVRQPLYSHFAVAWSAAFAQMEGRLDEAERLAAESMEMRTNMESADAESVYAAQLFLIRHGEGRLGELVDAVEQVVEANPNLAAWRAGAAARLPDGRARGRLRQGARAHGGEPGCRAARLLLAHGDRRAGRGEREAAARGERGRPVRDARALPRLPRAGGPRGQPRARGSPAGPARGRAGRPRDRRGAPRGRARQRPKAPACACSRRRPARSWTSWRRPRASSLRAARAARRARPAGPRARPAAPGRRHRTAGRARRSPPRPVRPSPPRPRPRACAPWA